MIYVLLLLVAIPGLIWGTSQLVSKNKGLMTGHATAVSHRMEHAKISSRNSDNWNRLVTFRFSDGSELELYVDKEGYAAIPDGVSGQLTWRGDNLVELCPTSEQTRHILPRLWEAGSKDYLIKEDRRLFLQRLCPGGWSAPGWWYSARTADRSCP